MIIKKRQCDCTERPECECKSAFRTTMWILGIGMVVGTAIGMATKKIFDEIFVEEEWTDEDWGEDDDDSIDFAID